MSDLIEVADTNGIRTIRMNRPDKKNALTQEMYVALAKAFDSADGNDSIRCLVICGVPGAFTAGNDLVDFLSASSGSVASIENAAAFLRSLARCRKPIVAAVDGQAIGIGTTMLFHCDYVITTPSARFATPFVSLGLVPEGASTLLMPRLMGQQKSFALLVMGQPLGASDARAAGFVNEIVEPDALETATAKAAHHIAALPPQAVQQSRQLLRGSPDETIRRIDDEARIFAERMTSPEAVAAFAAFVSRKRA